MDTLNDKNTAPIGLFDSGVGGRTIWKEILCFWQIIKMLPMVKKVVKRL